MQYKKGMNELCPIPELQLNTPMTFTKEFIEAFVNENYDLSVEASSLHGYDEQNFLLKSNTGKKYILKIATKLNQHTTLKTALYTTPLTAHLQSIYNPI